MKVLPGPQAGPSVELLLLSRRPTGGAANRTLCGRNRAATSRWGRRREFLAGSLNRHRATPTCDGVSITGPCKEMMSGTWAFREFAAAAAGSWLRDMLAALAIRRGRAPVVRSLRDRIRVELASSLARLRRNRTTEQPDYGATGLRGNRATVVYHHDSSRKSIVFLALWSEVARVFAARAGNKGDHGGRINRFREKATAAVTEHSANSAGVERIGLVPVGAVYHTPPAGRRS